MNKRTIKLYADRIVEESSAERFCHDKLHHCLLPSFITEYGDEIVNLRIAYRVFGKLNEDRNNCILIFHALTGDSNCAGYRDKDGWVSGWWEKLFGAGAGIDLDKYCIISPNHPLSCYGSSGPLDKEVGASEPLGLGFPDFSIRDIARVHKELIARLGLKKLYTVLGGSLGGMVALEWAIQFPELAKKVAVIAAPLANNAQALAFNHIQKKCFDLDPNFKGGRYYDGKRPNEGLSLARQIGMITFRHPVEFEKRFGRAVCYTEDERKRLFQIESYLEHQGKKLINRFDANSYIKLLDSTDGHDVSRGFGGFTEALSQVRSEMLFVSIDSDVLYPPEEIRTIAEMCTKLGVKANYKSIASLHGHDGFLIEAEQLNKIMNELINS